MHLQTVPERREWVALTRAPLAPLGCCVLLLTLATAAAAQAFEAGIQFTGVHLHKLDEGPFGIGGRLHYNLNRFAATDLEITHAPENSAGSFGETTALFGIRAGRRFDRLGLFTKGRAGLMHFGGDYFKTRLDKRTHPVAEFGGIVEYYARRRTIIRLDFGDTVIYYGAARLFNRPNPDALGTVHNYQTGLGLAFVF